MTPDFGGTVLDAEKSREHLKGGIEPQEATYGYGDVLETGTVVQPLVGDVANCGRDEREDELK